MALEVYNLVKEVLGVLPIELEFVYGICTILLSMYIFYAIFVLPYKIIIGEW